MLLSLALICLLGFLLSGIFQKIKLPGLLGMILTGIILGPYALDLISDSILDISADLRQIALVVIMLRAGLSLNIADLKKVGRPAILMCFLPASFEIIAIIILGPWLLGLSLIDSALLGTILAAVSPAVIVPRMLKILDEGYGKSKGIPQLIMAGASVDDIYVIVLFTSFLKIATTGDFSAKELLQVPSSILLGIGTGIVAGILLVKLFKKIHMRDTVKIMVILSLSFLIISLEAFLKDYIALSAILSVIAMGVVILQQYELLAKRLSQKYSKIWVIAELILFVLVGATVNISIIATTGWSTILLIGLALVVRISGVLLSLIKTDFSMQERVFCSISYVPKATVQAAIGGIPLAMGLESGNTILAVAVLVILITAPIGALGIDLTYKKILKKS